VRTPIKATAREPSNRPDTNQRLPTAHLTCEGQPVIQKGHEDQFPLPTLSGPLSVQSTDLCGNAPGRRGCADAARAQVAAFADALRFLSGRFCLPKRSRSVVGSDQSRPATDTHCATALGSRAGGFAKRPGRAATGRDGMRASRVLLLARGGVQPAVTRVIPPNNTGTWRPHRHQRRGQLTPPRLPRDPPGGDGGAGATSQKRTRRGAIRLNPFWLADSRPG
jgi:hypothetical protein